MIQEFNNIEINDNEDLIMDNIEINKNINIEENTILETEDLKKNNIHNITEVKKEKI